MLDSGVPRLAVDGTRVGYVGWCGDVSELKPAETAMRGANAQWQLGMESGKTVGWEGDLKSERDTWFGDLAVMLGQTERIRVGHVEDFRQLVHSDDKERVWRAVNDAKRNRSDYLAEFRIRRRDGLVKWVSARGKFYYALDGTPERMLGIAVDVTEQRHA